MSAQQHQTSLTGYLLRSAKWKMCNKNVGYLHFSTKHPSAPCESCWCHLTSCRCYHCQRRCDKRKGRLVLVTAQVPIILYLDSTINNVELLVIANVTLSRVEYWTFLLWALSTTVLSVLHQQVSRGDFNHLHLLLKRAIRWSHQTKQLRKVLTLDLDIWTTYYSCHNVVDSRNTHNL